MPVIAKQQPLHEVPQGNQSSSFCSPYRQLKEKFWESGPRNEDAVNSIMTQAKGCQPDSRGTGLGGSTLKATPPLAAEGGR